MMNKQRIADLAACLTGHVCHRAARGGGFTRAGLLSGLGGLTLALTGGLHGGPSDLHAQTTKAMSHGGESYRVVPASEAGGLINFPAMFSRGGVASPEASLEATTGVDPEGLFSDIAQVGHHAGGCQSCGTSCGGACGGGSPMYGHQSGYVPGSYGECPKCVPYCYGIVEALYMRNENMDEATFSRNFALENPDFEPGLRVTIGSSPDCVSGSEASFTGMTRWVTERGIASPDALSPIFRDGTAIPFVGAGNVIVTPPSLLDPAIQNVLFAMGANPNERADIQNQRYESEMWSFEASRTMIAWDVAKFLFGARYINFDEEFRIDSLNNNTSNVAGQPPVSTGSLLTDVTNRLIGVQVGVEIFNPVGRFSSTYFRGRAGGYLNLAELDTSAGYNGAEVFSASTNDREIAGMFEVGSGIRYQLGEMLAVRAGAELWYLTGVATADNQLPTQVTNNFLDGLTMDADVFFVGMTVGAELKY